MTVERAQIVGARLAALRELIDSHDAGAIRLGARRNFCWATLGGLSHVLLATEAAVAPLIVTPEDAVVLAPINEHARLAEEELAGLTLRTASVPWWDPDAMDAELERLADGRRVLTEGDVVEELETLRSVLTPMEHGRLDELSSVVLEASAAALQQAVPGASEHAVAAAAAAVVAERGARLPVILVAADERIARYRHPLPSEQRVERRVMIVVVGERWGLHVAHTAFRDLAPPSADERRAAAALSGVLSAMREATRPGNTLGGVLVAAQAAYSAHGIGDEWQFHHQGGTIGYGARERIAVPTDTTLIRPGMAFAWNPSAVGHKLEETLYLDGSGQPHVLTST